MDDETKRRSRSFAKLVLLLLLVVSAGYLAISWARHAFDDHFGESAVPKCTGDHRFQQVDIYPVELRGDLALDTCTGQLCKTWKWTARSFAGGAHAQYEGIPLCSLLAGASGRLNDARESR
jgi:hypothetical protein